MDLSSVVGLVLAVGFVGLAVLMGGSVGAYIDPLSMFIVIGGGTAATMMTVPLARFLKLHKTGMKAMMHKSVEPAEQITAIVELAEIARRDGILALEKQLDEIEDPFLVQGLRMAVDGSDPEAIKNILETEMDNLVDRHAAGRSMFDSFGKYAPAFGMIGTLIGLVAMLSNMDDPSSIGAGMAAALLTTLYGALMANVVFCPLADKLGMRSAEEILNRSMVIEGIMSIQSGDNPRNVESKLKTFLPPSMREDAASSEAA